MRGTEPTSRRERPGVEWFCKQARRPMKQTMLNGRGMTVLEIVVAMLIMTIGLAGIIALFPVGARLNEMAADDIYSAMTAQKALAAVRVRLGLREAGQAWSDTNPGGDVLGWNGEAAKGVEGFSGTILAAEETAPGVSTRLRATLRLGDIEVIAGVPQSGLVAWYDGLTSSGSLVDRSGNGNDGELHGDARRVGGGKIGEALDLDGSGDYVSLPAAVSNCKDFTFAAWAYWRGTSDNGSRFFEFGTSTESHCAFSPLVTSTNKTRFVIRHSGVEQILDVTKVAGNTWAHVAVTLQAATARIYINGVLMGSLPNVTLNPDDVGTGPHFFGRTRFSNPYFDGILDEIVIYNRALTASEIQELKTAGDNGEYPADSGPGTTVFDVKDQADDHDDCALLLITTGKGRCKLYRLGSETDANPPTFEPTEPGCVNFFADELSMGDTFRLVGARSANGEWATVPPQFFGDGTGPPPGSRYRLGEGATPEYGYLAIVSRLRDTEDTFRVDILVYKGYEETLPPEGNLPAVACYTTILSGGVLQ
jgi:hypothetical protein